MEPLNGRGRWCDPSRIGPRRCDKGDTFPRSRRKIYFSAPAPNFPRLSSTGVIVKPLLPTRAEPARPWRSNTRRGHRTPHDSARTRSEGPPRRLRIPRHGDDAPSPRWPWRHAPFGIAAKVNEQTVAHGAPGRSYRYLLAPKNACNILVPLDIGHPALQARDCR
jgi:hypothetical protein